jgi:hypothetical protein
MTQPRNIWPVLLCAFVLLGAFTLERALGVNRLAAVRAPTPRLVPATRQYDTVPETYFNESCNKGDQSGWGTAASGTDDDLTWDGGTANWEILNNACIRSDNFGGASNGIGDSHGDYTVQLDFTALASDEFAEIRIEVRRSGSDSYWCKFRNYGTGTVEIVENQSGQTILDDDVGSGTVTNGTVKCEVKDSLDNVYIRGKWWSGSEPGTWLVQGVDDDGGEIASGTTVLYISNNSSTDTIDITNIVGSGQTVSLDKPNAVLIGTHTSTSVMTGDAWQQRLNDLNATGLQARIVRLPAWWSALEPTDDNFSWTKMDSAVVRAKRADMEVLFSPQAFPDWFNGGSNPDNVADDSATTLNEFVEFMMTARERYDGDPMPKITYWSIWNEPNLDGFWNPQWPTLYGVMYGEVRDSFAVLDPSLKVGAGTVSNRYTGDTQGADFLDTLVAMNLDPEFIDIHIYPCGACSPEKDTTFENSWKDIAFYKDRYGDAYLWLTEWGWSLGDQSQDTVAAWTWRALQSLTDTTVYGDRVMLTTIFIDENTFETWSNFAMSGYCTESNLCGATYTDSFRVAGDTFRAFMLDYASPTFGDGRYVYVTDTTLFVFSGATTDTSVVPDTAVIAHNNFLGLTRLRPTGDKIMVLTYDVLDVAPLGLDSVNAIDSASVYGFSPTDTIRTLSVPQ